MKKHEIKQKTPAWFDFRRNHVMGTDAPALLGVSEYTTRLGVVYNKATGKSLEELTEEKKALFDKCHSVECTLIESLKDRYGLEAGIVGTCSKDGYERIGASFDAISHTEKCPFECKYLGKDIITLLKKHGQRAIPLQYIVQLKHQCLVMGVNTALFAVHNPDMEDGTVIVRVRFTDDDMRAYGHAILKECADLFMDVADFTDSAKPKSPHFYGYKILAARELKSRAEELERAAMEEFYSLQGSKSLSLKVRNEWQEIQVIRRSGHVNLSLVEKEHHIPDTYAKPSGYLDTIKSKEYFAEKGVLEEYLKPTLDAKRFCIDHNICIDKYRNPASYTFSTNQPKLKEAQNV